jgi:hypothetical protein
VLVNFSSIINLEGLLKSSNGRRVRYVVIGASAFPTHVYLRTTPDIDILIEPTLENASRTLEALADGGYNLTDLIANELFHKKILLRQFILKTENLVSVLATALSRFESGSPDRCPTCGSYRVLTVYQPELNIDPPYVAHCESCGWSSHNSEVGSNDARIRIASKRPSGP